MQALAHRRFGAPRLPRVEWADADRGLQALVALTGVGAAASSYAAMSTALRVMPPDQQSTACFRIPWVIGTTTVEVQNLHTQLGPAAACATAALYGRSRHALALGCCAGVCAAIAHDALTRRVVFKPCGA